MSNSETQEQKNSEELASQANFMVMLTQGQIAFGWVKALLAFALLVYFMRFGLPFIFSLPEALQTDSPGSFIFSNLGSTGDWGTFGDFLGGLLNPAVGIATVYLILLNVRMQKQEMGYALREMKNSNEALLKQNAAIEVQNFQNTFFNWLGAYRDLTNKVETTVSAGGNPKTCYGASAMRRIYVRTFTERAVRFQLNEDDLDEHADEVINRQAISIKENAWAVERSLLELWRGMVLTTKTLWILCFDRYLV